MKRMFSAIAIMLVVAMCLSACGSTVPVQETNTVEHIEESVAEEIATQEESEVSEGTEESVVGEDQPISDEPVEESIVTTGNFDDDFVAYIQSLNERDNYVVSPLSFRVALALAEAGADGQTKEQLLNAMGFESEGELDEWYASVKSSMMQFDHWVEQELRYVENSDELESNFAYRVLNGVWNNTSLYGDFLPSYVDKIGEKFDATADAVPADEITDVVNKWCEEATSGLIPKISDDMSNFASVLVNAIYLKTSWFDSFDEFKTTPEDFTDIDGNVSQREMMKEKDSYRFFENDKTKLIVIHLNGGFDFVAVLGDSTNWLENYDVSEYEDVDLWIPKLDTESTFEKDVMIGYLQAQGVVDAFDVNKADFSQMADFPWLIDDIIQKARIKTDEEGLEAAAVTMIGMALGAALEEHEPEYKEFHATEPFKYYVVSNVSGQPIVVFAGQEVR